MGFKRLNATFLKAKPYGDWHFPIIDRLHSFLLEKFKREETINSEILISMSFASILVLSLSNKTQGQLLFKFFFCVMIFFHQIWSTIFEIQSAYYTIVKYGKLAVNDEWWCSKIVTWSDGQKRQNHVADQNGLYFPNISLVLLFELSK